MCLLSRDQSEHKTFPWCPFKILRCLIFKAPRCSNLCATLGTDKENDMKGYCLLAAETLSSSQAKIH